MANRIDTRELKVGQDKELILPSTGSISREMEELRQVEVVDKPAEKTMLDALAFMEERVTVMLMDDSNPNAENPVQVSCNGVNQFFMRGQAQDVKRKFVEILARAKRTVISTPETTDSTGSRTNMIRQSTSLRYPFQVVADPNPRGPQWLKGIMQEA